MPARADDSGITSDCEMSTGKDIIRHGDAGGRTFLTSFSAGGIQGLLTGGRRESIGPKPITLLRTFATMKRKIIISVRTTRSLVSR